MKVSVLESALVEVESEGTAAARLYGVAKVIGSTRLPMTKLRGIVLREDLDRHRANGEKIDVPALAKRYGVTVQLVYLILRQARQ